MILQLEIYLFFLLFCSCSSIASIPLVIVSPSNPFWSGFSIFCEFCSKCVSQHLLLSRNLNAIKECKCSQRIYKPESIDFFVSAFHFSFDTMGPMWYAVP